MPFDLVFRKRLLQCGLNARYRCGKVRTVKDHSLKEVAASDAVGELIERNDVSAVSGNCSRNRRYETRLVLAFHDEASVVDQIILSYRHFQIPLRLCVRSLSAQLVIEC